MSLRIARLSSVGLLTLEWFPSHSMTAVKDD